MRKPKTDKLLKGLVGTSLAVATLTGCGINRPELTAIPEYSEAYTEGSEALLPSPGEADCDTWVWDEEDGAYQCIEEGSERYGHYYHKGKWYPTKSKFRSAKATTSSSVTKSNSVSQPKTNTNSTVTNSKSGMGSGGSYGG